MAKTRKGMYNFSWGVNSVIASTLKDNTASYAVLQKNGFIKTGESADMFHWRYNIR